MFAALIKYIEENGGMRRVVYTYQGVRLANRFILEAGTVFVYDEFESLVGWFTAEGLNKFIDEATDKELTIAIGALARCAQKRASAQLEAFSRITGRP